MDNKLTLCSKCNNKISETENICPFCDSETEKKTKYTFETTNGFLGIGIRGLSNYFKTEVVLSNDGSVEISKFAGRYKAPDNRLPNLFEGSTISAYGLPLSMGSFENTDGGVTLCPIVAGSYISTIE